MLQSQDNHITITMRIEDFSIEETPAKPNKIFLLVMGSVMTLGIVLFAWGLTIGTASAKSNFSEFNDLFAKQTLSELSLDNIISNNLTNFEGFVIEKNEDSESLIVLFYILKFTFDSDYKGDDDGLPVSVRLYLDNVNGIDESVYGIGYLKGDDLTLYEAEVFKLDDPETRDVMRSMDNFLIDDEEGIVVGHLYFEDKKILLEGKVSDFSRFNVKLYSLWPHKFDSTPADLLVYNRLTLYKTYASTPTSVFESQGGETVEIQLLPPPNNNTYNAKALVYGYMRDIKDNDYEEGMSGYFYSAINIENKFMLDCDPMPYLGEGVLGNDTLKIDDNGNIRIFPLKERMIFDNAELNESIAEMEGWD